MKLALPCSAAFVALLASLCPRLAHAQDPLAQPSAAPAPVAAASTPPAAEPAESSEATPPRLCNGFRRHQMPDHETASGFSIGCPDAIGLRGSEVHVFGASADEGAGLMFFAGGEEFGHERFWSSRDTYGLALGGGGAGLEGELSGSIAYGFRAPVTRDQGPVVRAAASAHLLGNNAFYSSLLELPQAQVGWQWSHGYAVVEVAGAAGLVLTGRFRAGDAATRELGGFAFGGHASLQVPWVRFTMEAERLPSGDALTAPVDVLGGTLCAVAFPMAVCADGRAEQSRAWVGAGQPLVTAAYAGLTIGFTGSD
jgi:hypothetical protein